MCLAFLWLLLLCEFVGWRFDLWFTALLCSCVSELVGLFVLLLTILAWVLWCFVLLLLIACG